MSVQEIRLSRLMILSRRKVQDGYPSSYQGTQYGPTRDETDYEYSDRINYILDQAHNYNEIQIESWKMELDRCYIVYSIPRQVYTNAHSFPHNLYPNNNSSLRYV